MTKKTAGWSQKQNINAKIFSIQKGQASASSCPDTTDEEKRLQRTYELLRMPK